MKIKITEHFHAYGPQFENIKVGNIYETVKAPAGMGHLSGQWIEGVGGEPVRVLPIEYTVVQW